MAMCIGLISTIKDNDIYNIIVITDSISAVSKVLESHVNPFQNYVILLTSRIKTYLKKDKRNIIHFWQCPSKAKWSRQKLVNDQVKVANNILTFSYLAKKRNMTISSKNGNFYS